MSCINHGSALGGLTRALIVWAGVTGILAPAAPAPAADVSVRSYFEAARAFLGEGDGARGLPLLAAAAVAGRDTGPAQVYLLGVLNQTCFEWDLAGLEAARPVLPDDPALLECLGRRYEGQGRYDEAESAFLRWAGSHPELAEPYARVGELYVTAKRPDRALAAFARYRELNPGSNYAVRRMADVAVDRVERFWPRASVPAKVISAPGPPHLTAGPDAEAQFGLAVRYQHGLGVPVDPTLAAEAYARAARLGHPVAQLRLAVRLQEGHGIARDPEAAARWLARAAESGVPEAQLRLALACLTGNGLPRDAAQAVSWSRRAAVKGLPEAQFLLGTLYQYGIGTGRDADTATEWLLKAGATFLETGKWRAGRAAVLASFEAERPGPPTGPRD
jgi:tetratricopeptide (TPR) repeat protein